MLLGPLVALWYIVSNRLFGNQTIHFIKSGHSGMGRILEENIGSSKVLGVQPHLEGHAGKVVEGNPEEEPVNQTFDNHKETKHQPVGKTSPVSL